MIEMEGDLEAKRRIMRKVHRLAKEIWGEKKVGGIPAYIFWTRVWAKIVYGVERRRELPLDGWLNMLEWLQKLRREVSLDGTDGESESGKHFLRR